MAMPMRPLPAAHDDVVEGDLDVRLRTPSTLVVHARLEAAEAGAGGVELALVIPRSRCRGERPLAGALREAARAAVARTMRAGASPQACRPLRVVTQVAGLTYLVCQVDAG